MTKLNIYFDNLGIRLRKWVEQKYFQLAILNVFLLSLVLLKSAGYFEPYFPITINVIVILGVLASIFLLKISSSFVFVTSLVFWVLTALFRILYIIPWAERTALYSFEAFAIGMAYLILEAILKRKN